MSAVSVGGQEANAPILSPLPQHWDVVPVKRQYEVRLGKMLQSSPSSPADELRPYLRAINIQPTGLEFEDVREMWFRPGEFKQLRLQNGDLVVSEGGDVGRSAIFRHHRVDVAIQNAINRVRPRKDASTTYLHYWLQAVKEAGYIEVLCNRSTIPHFTAEKLSELLMPLPPPGEQCRIAAFLDHETARIDELVREQERLGTMLLERRSALVVAAVSGQLSSAKMVDSRIPWLSKIAYGWQEVQIRRVAKLGTGHTPSRSRPDYWEDCTIPWVTTGEVVQIRQDHIEYLYETREKISEVGLANSSAVLHPAGTVFLSRTASAGFSGIMGLPMATSQDYVTWTCGEKLNPRFLLLCLRAMRSDLLGRLAMGSTHKTIYMPEVEQLMIPLPPLAEQTRLVELAWNELSQIDSALELLTQRSELLRERRSALISAAVTGQLDLRSWQLPELETIAEVA